jgi:hypothetical protein
MRPCCPHSGNKELSYSPNDIIKVTCTNIYAEGVEEAVGVVVSLIQSCTEESAAGGTAPEPGRTFIL